MENIGTQGIETDRLFLRQFELDDLEDIYNNWQSDDEYYEFLPNFPAKNLKEAEESLLSWIRGYEDLTNYRWAIVLKKEKKVIGNIKVVRVIDGIDCVEIGYGVCKRYWGKGIMTEALSAVKDYLFDKVQVNKILARCDTRNEASRQVMIKNGFQYEGTLRDSRIDKDGKLADAYYYAILKRERKSK